MTLAALFFSAFLAATLLPGGSEVALVYLDHVSQHGFWTLIAVATAGNTLGGMVSYAMGRVVPRGNLKMPRLQKAIAWVERFGAPALLLSWVPVIGDVLCVAAGWLRVNWVAATVFIGLGKTARYMLVLFAI